MLIVNFPNIYLHKCVFYVNNGVRLRATGIRYFSEYLVGMARE